MVGQAIVLHFPKAFPHVASLISILATTPETFQNASLCSQIISLTFLLPKLFSDEGKRALNIKRE